MGRPQAQEIYRHFKGELYQIITIARHSETSEELVIYQALYGEYKVYARPLVSFIEEIGTGKYRFSLFHPTETKTADIKAMPAGTVTVESKEETKEETETKEEAELNDEFDLSAIDPLLLEFLNAETYEKRYSILTALHSRITDEMINTIAASLELEIAAGEIEKRYMELRHCLTTMKKFEINR
ncbi:MAG: DUF1653 domain-containing protein [Lachnospiraceae bacterium]|nr:DUF1653 domain-containing protein [Lachnospiraceae bacterium]